MDFDGISIDFGPLEPLMEDEMIQEIMVNGHRAIYVERKGGSEGLEEIPAQFRDEPHLRQVVGGILAALGHSVSVESPIADVRLPDGSRMLVIAPPVSVYGTSVVIRRLLVGWRLSAEDVLRFGSWSQDIADFLRACVKARLNLIVSGGTGSGKTTVLNILTDMIPDDERLVVVQSGDELGISHKNVIKLDARPPDAGGKGEVTIQELVVNATRMRPDRIVLGELHGAEALDLLQAMRSGHDGTLCSIHSNGPRDTLARLETMAMMHTVSLPLLTIRQHIASSVHLITHQERLPDGKRKIIKITEVLGMRGEQIETQDIFEFIQTGIDEDGYIVGHFTPTGVIPGIMDRFRSAGIGFPEGFFQLRQ